MAIVLEDASRRPWRPKWSAIAVVAADLAVWLGILVLCVLWTRVEAAELPQPGAVCTTTDRAGAEQRATVQFLEPADGRESDRWAWVTIDAPAPIFWAWHRVRLSALRGCK